jgi:hypothetical protein
MLNYQVRSVPVYSTPVTAYLVAIDSRYRMEESKPEGYSLNELQSLANMANSQYLDLESAENELAAWIRNANRGPQASANPSNEFTPGKLPFNFLPAWRSFIRR